MREYICRDLTNKSGETVGREYKGEIIRCRYCKHWMDSAGGGHYCYWGALRRKPNDFCSWGEREEK